MTVAICTSVSAHLDIDDSISMDDAVDQWGEADALEAAEFRRGWRDERKAVYLPPKGMVESCAYNSGVVAARHHAQGVR